MEQEINWNIFSHTSPLGNTGDYMSDCGIENGTYTLFCDKPEDISNEELQEICDKLNTHSKDVKPESISDGWISVEEYENAVNHIEQLQVQLKEAEEEIRDLNRELNSMN